MASKNNTYKLGAHISFSEPYAHILCDSERGNFCDNCFKTCERLLRCSSCAELRYCDAQCQRSDWRFHKEECKHFKRLAPKVPSDSMRLFYRLLLRHQWGDSSGVKEEFGAVTRSFNDLMSHTDSIKGDRARVQAFMTMCTMLQAFTSNKFTFPEASVAIQTFGKMMVNSFSICDGEMKPIGVGLYLGASVLDHSCEPTAVVTFSGTQLNLHCTATTPVTFDQVRISYVELLSPHAERQDQLTKQYYFTCTCTRCKNTTGDLSLLSSACPQCHGPVPETQDETFLPCTKCGFADFDEEYGTRVSATTTNCTEALEAMKKIHREQDFESLLERAETELRRLEGVLHAESVLSVRVVDKAMDAAIGLQDMQKACEYAHRNTNAYRRYYPDFHPSLGLHLLKLGKIQLYLKEHKEAKTSLSQARDILAVTHGEGHQIVYDSSQLLDQCIEEMERDY